MTATHSLAFESQLTLNVIRAVFLIAVGAMTTNACSKQTFVTLYCFGSVALYIASLAADVNLARQSCRGSLNDSERRQGVTAAVSIRFGFMIAEFASVCTRTLAMGYSPVAMHVHRAARRCRLWSDSSWCSSEFRAAPASKLKTSRIMTPVWYWCGA